MKSITKASHTLAEALDRMRTKIVRAEDCGQSTVSIGREDVLNLKDAAFRCNDYARLDNAQDSAFSRGVQRERISCLRSASTWATERGHDDFAKYLATLATEWEARGR